MARQLRRLQFNLEGQLEDVRTNRKVNATSLPVPPQLVDVDTTGIPNSDSYDERYLERIHMAVHQLDPMLPVYANGYVSSVAKGKGSIEHQVWVPIQFYRVE